MKRIMILLIILMNLSVALYGQLDLSAKGVANLNANGGNTRGWEVIGNNPANLGHSSKYLSMNLGILPLISFPSVELGNTSLSISLLNNEFFIGDELSESNKQALLDAIDDDGITPYFRVNQNIFTMSQNNWAIGIGVEGYGTATLPKSLVEFGLKGNEFDVPIDISDLGAEMISFGKISYNYGKKYHNAKINQYVNNFYWGIGVDFLYGGLYEKTEDTKGSITTSIDGFDVYGNSVVTAATGGVGFALDLGVAADINDKLSAGFYLQNILNMINWGTMGINLIDGDNAKKMKYTYEIQLASHEFFEDDVDSLLEEGTKMDTSYAISGFNTSVPRGYNLNASYKVTDKFRVNAAIFGYLTSDYGLSMIPNISTSVNYLPVKWWPLTLGVGTSRQSQLSWSFGTGLNFDRYHLNIGLSQYGGMFNYSKGFFFAIDQSFYF